MARQVTMDDVAAKAGVSRAAVSLAMRQSPKISAARREHILRTANELGYRPNIIASRLARAEVSTFGILLSDLHNPIMADLLDGFAPPSAEGEFEMYLASGFNEAEREKFAIDSFLAHRVKGVALVGSRLHADEIRELAEAVPTVVIGRSVPGVDCVLVNDERGGSLVAEHLLALGHRSLAHIDGGTGAGAQKRKKAFTDTCLQVAGVTVATEAGDYSQAAGYRGAYALLAAAPQPTAIFAANDLMALGALGAARERGLVAGKDFALCGFDDIAIAGYGYVSLTTVSYSREEMGTIAKRLLELRCASPTRPAEVIQLQPSLVVRETSGTKLLQGG